MEQFRDPRGITRVAIAALIIHLVVNLAEGFALYLDRDPLGWAGPLAVALLIVLFACVVIVGRWIYVTNANAHSFGTGEMDIGPGWAVGWFFVPLANLVKPYEAMKEAWGTSHRFGGLYEEAEAPLVGWWWAFWIASGVVSWAGLTLQRGAPTPPEAFYYVDLLGRFLNVACSLVLIQIMRRMAAAQLTARNSGVFA